MAEESLWAGRGDRRDFILGTAVEGWTGFEIVRWRATEALGKPFQIELTTARPRDQGALDLPAFLNQAATFRIASEKRWRNLHGIIVMAEELERTRALHLYRFAMAPPSFRMSQRVRFRTFVDNTLRQVLVALLENRSTKHPMGHGGLASRTDAPGPSLTAPSFDSFKAPRFEYRFAVEDASRLDDPELRRYVVQYGESDHDLFHRLIEEEGLTYFFEHAGDAMVMTIVDRPGQVSPFSREDRRALRGDARGSDVSDRETIRSLRRADKLLWGGTSARDWDAKRSMNRQEAFVTDDAPAASGSTQSPDVDLFAHDLFPSRDAEVGTPCAVPANLAVQRRAVERSRRVGRSNVRTLEPGLKLGVEDPSGLYDDQSLVVIAVTTYATQRLPENTLLDDEPWGLSGKPHEPGTYENEFAAVPSDVRFRPELSTAPPRIHGIHTAVVSADETSGKPPEIHINDLSQVRLRFPWDERIEPGRPSSCWVRVSQAWAGASFGDVFVPRVGQEVLVAYLGGDPERPMVVGRVYNATNPIPYTKPTISTLKSKSSPDSDGYNELRFDDDAGNEEVYLQAEKNLNELVKSSHSTSVGGDQSNGVGGNQSNSVQGKRTHDVGATETNTIGSDRTTTVGGSESYKIAASLTTSIGALEERSVAANRTTYVGANDHLVVQAARTTLVAAAEKREVAGPDRVAVGATRTVTVAGEHVMNSHSANKLYAPVFEATGGSACVFGEDGVIEVSNGAGASIVMFGGMVTIKADTIILEAGDVFIKAKNCINGEASLIKLNG